MTEALTAGALFDALCERLEISWVAGERGRGRAIEPTPNDDMRPSLTGFLNLVHPNDIQVIGSEELKYLDSLDSRKRWETVADVFSDKPVAIIVTDSLVPPDDIIESADETSTPLWSAPETSFRMVGMLQHFLSRRMARQVTLHGVFIEVYSIGVLLTGDSGSGKSELALELISRGHRLIADDAPEMTRISPEVIDGTCPEVLKDCLEVRGLGILNIREMFGDSAVKPNKYLRLIIHLDITAGSNDKTMRELDRLHGDISSRDVLGIEIPVITVPVAAGRNIAVIVEAAVLNHSLKMKGHDAPKEFLKRHEMLLKKDAAR